VKSYTPIIILALIAAGVGYYIYTQQKAAAAAKPAGTTVNITAEVGGTRAPAAETISNSEIKQVA
jgi:hypothetical protein